MKKWLSLILILFVVIWIVFMSIKVSEQFIEPTKRNTKSTYNKDTIQNQNTEDTTNPQNNQETYSQTPSSSSCYKKQIPYSIKNVKKEINQSKINCSLEIKNLDNEKTGDFKIKFILSPNKTSIKTIALNPKESIIVYNEFNTSSENPNCSYKTIEIPTKQVC